MANEAMSILETNIRRSAIDEARRDFDLKIREALSPGFPISTRGAFSQEDWKRLGELHRSFFDNLIAPTVSDRAVKQFVGTYKNLVQQFPELIPEESSDDDG